MRNATLRAARALASGAIAAALVSAAATASAAQIDPRLRAAADSFAAPSGGPQTAWADLSDESRLRAERRQDMLVEAVRRIPRAELRTPAELLLHDNLSEIVEARRGTRVCRAHLWAGTSQFGGWHVAASNAARVQRVGTP